MGWEAYLTKDGQSLEKNQGQIADPNLRQIFLEAAAEVKQLAGWCGCCIAEGSLDGFSCQLVLAKATGVVCFDEKNVIGEIVWSPAYIQHLQLKASWDFPMEAETDISDPNWYDVTDYWGTRIFFQTCRVHNLGMLLTW